MIINFATGLYRNVLPHNPSDGGNVTYTISNTSPPRTDLIFLKIPIGVVNQQRTPNILTPRNSVGSLIFAVSSAQRQDLGNNSRQYELGQILEFADSVDQPIVQQMLVNQITETRHDTSVLDNSVLGLDQSEADLIATTSTQAYAILSSSLNQLKQLRADAESEIASQQKAINELNRTITALQVVQQQAPDNGVQDLIIKLQTRRDAIIVAMNQTITNANAYSTQAADIVNQLRSVAVVVK